MQKFNVKEWLERCKSCKYSKYSRSIEGTTCSIKGTCNYKERREDEAMEEELENGKNSLGRICPVCGEFFYYAHSSPTNIRNGVKYYACCRECKNRRQREYNRKAREKRNG